MKFKNFLNEKLEQAHICMIYNSKGENVDFFRLCQKTLKGCLKFLVRGSGFADRGWSSFMLRDDWYEIKIFKTKSDGTEETLVYDEPLINFFKETNVLDEVKKNLEFEMQFKDNHNYKETKFFKELTRS